MSVHPIVESWVRSIHKMKDDKKFKDPKWREFRDRALALDPEIHGVIFVSNLLDIAMDIWPTTEAPPPQIQHSLEVLFRGVS